MSVKIMYIFLKTCLGSSELIFSALMFTSYQPIEYCLILVIATYLISGVTTCSGSVAMASNGDLRASLNHQGTGPGGQWGFQQ